MDEKGLLAFRGRLLFSSDRSTRPPSGPPIGMGALSPNRQSLSVTQATVGTHLHVAFDIRRRLTSEIPFYLYPLVDNAPDFDHPIIGEYIAVGIQMDAGLLEDRPRAAPSNPVNISQCDLHSFILG